MKIVRPTDAWPDDKPLIPELVEAALWTANGNVRKAAQILRTTSGRLGALLALDPHLAEVRQRAAELLIDKAEAVMGDLLEDPDRQEDAAKWILSNGGKARGWGKDAPAGGMSLSFRTGGGPVTIRWQDEKPDPPTIDVTPDDGSSR